MHHVMIDLETLSTSPEAAVIAIGLVLFDESQIIAKTEILIRPTLAIGDRDEKTVDWWYSQDKAVFDKMMSGTSTPWGAVAKFIETWETWCNAYSLDLDLWANPPSFDIVILRFLFHKVGQPFPVHFSKERDFRTMKALALQQDIDFSEPYKTITAHDAVSDAIAQAKALQIIMRKLIHPRV